MCLSSTAIFEKSPHNQKFRKIGLLAVGLNGFISGLLLQQHLLYKPPTFHVDSRRYVFVHAFKKAGSVGFLQIRSNYYSDHWIFFCIYSLEFSVLLVQLHYSLG